MKKHIIYILSLSALFAGCDDKVPSMLTLLPSGELSLEAPDTVSSFRILSDANWTITGGEESDWCRLDGDRSGKGEYRVTLRMDSNRVFTPRSVAYTVEGDGHLRTMTVTQKQEYLLLSQNVIRIPYTGGEDVKLFHLQTSGPLREGSQIRITIDKEFEKWVFPEGVAGGDPTLGVDIIATSIPENTLQEEKTGSITVSVSVEGLITSVTRKLTFIQEAKP